jgi:Putative zinc ribbon domain
MSSERREGPCCQSCGMPLTNPEQFGTAADGHRANDYCHFCYVDGEFTNPDMTMPEMADFCAAVLTRRGMSESQARTMMTGTLPALKRWRAPVDGHAVSARA